MAELDVIIIGAGLSGIGAGCRLSEEPGLTWAILEKRPDTGGTWDVFRYPGIRSDSSMQTLGYRFRPWKGDKDIASGQQILDYIRQAAAERGVNRHIRTEHRVLAATWHGDLARWSLRVAHPGGEETLWARFIIAGTGYYNNERGYAPDFPGVETFAGELVHPQHWGQTAFEGTRVAVIGSGATAVTLVPELARSAASVTMIQRSPTDVVVMPEVVPGGRVGDIARGTLTYWFARRFPEVARRSMLRDAQRALGPDIDASRHFAPSYDPWDQRICVAPQGDLFKVLREGRARVVTGEIDRFETEGVRMRDGSLVAADLIVTATGLELEFLGGIALDVDGRRLRPKDCALYRSAMLSGVPNMILLTGYTNASWTLRSGLSVDLFLKIYRHMERAGHAVVRAPTPPSALDGEAPLNSGYMRRGQDQIPLQGKRHPWRLSRYYVLDWLRETTTPVAWGLDYETRDARHLSTAKEAFAP